MPGFFAQQSDRRPVINFGRNEGLKGLQFLDPLYQAIIHRRVLEANYQSFTAREASLLVFHPYLLKEFNNRWFLLGKKQGQKNLLLPDTPLSDTLNSNMPSFNISYLCPSQKPNIMDRALFFFALTTLSTLFLSSCGSAPRGAYSPEAVPLAPDYSQDQYWAALPWRQDEADLTPNGLTNRQAEAEADVFFLHPTTYSGKKGDTNWNGPVHDPEVNRRALEKPIKFQASIFNGAGRVFAPFYRQAHLKAYFTRDTSSARQAFDLAYSDVRAAFQYYLDNHNDGRPIIIASHSQGTTHGKRLMQEFFDDKPLQERLVAAYLVGITVENGDFQELSPCQDSLDTGCFTAWRTFKRGYEPRKTIPDEVVINPMLWTADETYAPKSLNLGAVLTPFEEVRPENTDAQVHGSILWASKPKFPGSFLLVRRNYHAGDYNLFYVNIRENARARVRAFLAGR